MLSWGQIHCLAAEGSNVSGRGTFEALSAKS